MTSGWNVYAGLIDLRTKDWMGSSSGVSFILSHPLYDSTTNDYDIALMRLQSDMHFSGEYYFTFYLPVFYLFSFIN